MPDVPVQCPPVLFGEKGLGQWRREVGRIFEDGVKLANVRGRWQEEAWGGDPGWSGRSRRGSIHSRKGWQLG